MKHKPYCVVTGALFAIVALAHLARLAFGWSIYVDTQVVPMWVSVLGLVIPGGLAVWAFRLSTRSGSDA
jgi:hypothetical protein